MSDTALSVDVLSLVLQATSGGVADSVIVPTGGSGVLFDISTLLGYSASAGGVAAGNVAGNGLCRAFDVSVLLLLGSVSLPAPSDEFKPSASGGGGALIQLVGRFPLPGDNLSKVDFGIDTKRSKKQRVFTVV